MQEPGNLQVVLMGMITVFICLIILIVLIGVMSKIVQSFSKAPAAVGAESQPVPTPAMAVSSAEKQRIVAAISAAVAEELKTDVSGFKIHSIKRLEK